MTLTRSTCIALCLFALGGPALAEQTSPPRQIVNVDSAGRYKVVYDIHTATTAAGTSKGLYYARGLIEAFGKQGVKPNQLDIHLVLHGDAARYLLVDETYRDAVNDPFAVNLNAKITQDLLDLGVSVEICHSVMKARGWTAPTCCLASPSCTTATRGSSSCRTTATPTSPGFEAHGR